MLSHIFRQWLRAFSKAPSMGHQGTPSRAEQRRSCQPQLEELETRVVLSARVGLSHGVLRAVSNNAPTTVTLRQAGRFTILNGFKAPTNSIKRIDIIGGARKDTIVVRDTPAGKPVTVKTGRGNDSIHVGSATNLLDTIMGNLNVNGGRGRDALFLHDGADQGGQSYNVSANSISRSGAALISFSPTTEALSLTAGVGDDVVRLLSNSVAAKLSLNGGDGNNSLFALDGNLDAPVHNPSAVLKSVSSIDRLVTPWTRDPINLAVKLDRDLDLIHCPEDWQYPNWGGKGEKWLVDAPERVYYFILPNGELYRWDSSSGQQAVGELIATLDPSFHEDVHRLSRAENLLAAGQIQGPIAELAARLDRDLGLHVQGEDAWLNRGGKGERWLLGATQRGWYFILPNGELYRWHLSSSQQAVGELVATLDPSYHEDVYKLAHAESLFAAGQIQGPIAELAARLDHDLGLHVQGEDAAVSWGGKGEKWLVDAPERELYFILPTGELYRWDGSRDADGLESASGELLATLDPSFHENLTRLTEAKEIFGDLDLQALAAIQQRHAETGGDAGRLGAAVTGLQLTADGRSWYMDFQNGAIYHSWWQGTLVLDGGNWQEYQAGGRHNGGLGLPLEEPTSTVNADTLVAPYEQGAVYYSPGTGAHAVYGPIYSRYKVLKQERGVLGLPTSSVTVNADGGQLVTFERGAMYLHPNGRILEVRDDIYARWLREGGATGELGYPTDKEQKFVGDPYRAQSFQHGTIVEETATGHTFLVKWLINGKWLNKGGMTGVLGAPLREEELIPGGVLQRFQFGTIYYKWGADEAFEVHDDIHDRYESLGGPGGLGFPTTDEFIDASGGRVSLFERGDIFFSGWTGIQVHVYRMPLPHRNPQNDTWSCGPNSMSRLLGYYGYANATYETVRDATGKDNILSMVGMGTRPQDLLDVGRQWKPDLQMESETSFERVLGLLSQGKPVIALVSVGLVDTEVAAAVGAIAGAAVGGLLGGVIGGVAGATEDVPELHYVTLTGYNERTGEIYYTETKPFKDTDPNVDVNYHRSWSFNDFKAKWDWHQSPLVGKAFFNGILGIKVRTILF